MLFITRRPGERILIGDDVVVEVVACTGGGVRLGIEAPRSTRIYREEVWAAIKDENTAAAASSPEALAQVPRTPEGEEVPCP